MPANQLAQVRGDASVKEEAGAGLAAKGLTVSDAVRLPLTKVVEEKTRPCAPLVPSPVPIAAMRAARRGTLSRFNSVQALLDNLHAGGGGIQLQSPVRDSIGTGISGQSCHVGQG